MKIYIIIVFISITLNAQTIVCYGTSLTATGRWTNILEDSLRKNNPNIKVINSGQGAMNSNWGVANLNNKVIKFSPDIVLMEFSINDAYKPETYYKSVDLNKSRDNFISMIDTIKAHLPNCKVYLMTMNIPTDSMIADRNPYRSRILLSIFNSQVQEIAKEKGVGFIDITAEWKKIDVEIYLNRYSPNDGLHINELGSKEVIVPKIISILTK